MRDLAGLQSALAQPHMSFGGQELYSRALEKCAALAFSIVNNHPFVDGNKRIAHAVLEVSLNLNGLRIDATIDEEEQLMLGLASGDRDRADLLEWLGQHVVDEDT